MEAANDVELFFDEWERQHDTHNEKDAVKYEADQLSAGILPPEDETQNIDPIVDGESPVDGSIKAVRLSDAARGSSEVTSKDAITAAEDIVMSDIKLDNTPNETTEFQKSTNPDQDTEALADGLSASNNVVYAPEAIDQSGDLDKDGLEAAEVEGTAEDQDEIPIPRRMRTRAQAQAASDNTTTSRTRSMTPDSSAENAIHPYFLAPQKSHPDRDLGLPPHEAEETRRLLQLYIQKQEEVCRGAQRVYEGLLRADRYRHLVMKWAKAEGHVGADRDMSDGEDWYDKDEWGLTEDLKKGQDEEEEDAATTAKKTRTRRQ